MEKKPQYKVVVSDRARQMLASHVRFLAQKSPEAARKIKNDLMNAIRSLYHMLERFPFLETEFIPPNKYHNERLCNKLCNAISGRGAFRRFKDATILYNLENNWYSYKHKTLFKVARDWCEVNDISFVED